MKTLAVTTFRRLRKRKKTKRGGALMISLIAVTVLAGLSAAILGVATTSHQELRSANEQVRALYTAEAGISDAMASVRAGVEADVGSAGGPVAFGGGAYWVDVIDNGDSTLTLTSRAAHFGENRSLEVVIRRQTGGIFANAVFAGNSGGDPNYTLGFGGLAAQADHIDGNVYSGADVTLVGDAVVSGSIRAGGTISGSGGDEGSSQPTPDIAGMSYATNHDVDVAGEFSGGSASWTSDAFGGSAWQLPEDNPAHIFRKNPDDRSGDVNGTAKNDYFLEDPYEQVRADSNQDGSDPSLITLSGGDDPGPDGNDLVYYVDGNLWVHNVPVYSLSLRQEGNTSGVRVTFVVEGNVYFSDNLFYGDPSLDAAAFIAIEDANEPDSGNIYFGDPSFGTLEFMDAYMYAENDFYDNNLSASGSSEVKIRGNMTAGNQVAINRDWGSQHSRLSVEFDDRVWTGSVALPGLPGQAGSDGGLDVLSWREVSSPRQLAPRPVQATSQGGTSTSPAGGGPTTP